MNQYVPVVERFWARVRKAGPDECWLWTGGKNSYGYGILRTARLGRPRGAHRFSWELHNGAIPDGLQVLHRCDVRNCVNPAHLFLGNNQDNTADKVAKGRQSALRGEKQVFARLTEAQVRQIRELHGNGLSNGAIGEKFGVGSEAISKVIRGVNWKHVE
jgi:hypothetical protein